MSDVAIKVEGLSKRYRIGQYVGGGAYQYRALRDVLTDVMYAPFHRLRARSKQRAVASNPTADSHELSAMSYQPSANFIWALKDVSLEVKQGEVVGIIGRNGAGKTTLLKVLSRITEPTEGRAEIKGRVGSLLEVGTGFHPELTGRENVYLSGAILGMTKKEIDCKFDEIVAFAELEKFIDTPVKRYSSGMLVRLGFAVAAHLEPEILLVDEVLAVGDAAFQKKCLGKMGDVSKEGRTVLFVSHNMSAVQHLCDSAMLLQEGKLAYNGEVGRCVERYLGTDTEHPGSILDHITHNDPAIKLHKVIVNGLHSDVLDLALGHRWLDIAVSGQIDQPMRLLIEARIYDSHERCLAFFTPHQFREHFDLLPAGSFRLTEKIGLPCVNKGEYLLSLYISRAGYPRSLVHIERSVRIKAKGTPTITGWVFKYARGNGWMLLPGTQERFNATNSALSSVEDQTEGTPRE